MVKSPLISGSLQNCDVRTIVDVIPRGEDCRSDKYKRWP